jgi:hemerythrin
MPEGMPETRDPHRVHWTERLAVGVEEIDAQHQELYRRVDGFLRALDQRRGRGEVMPLVAYLEQYVRSHFAAEQQLMELSGYDGLGDHLAEHHWFEEEYRRLAERLALEGVTLDLAQALVWLLVGWLDYHLESTDRKLGAYLATRRRIRGGAARA